MSVGGKKSSSCPPPEIQRASTACLPAARRAALTGWSARMARTSLRRPLHLFGGFALDGRLVQHEARERHGGRRGDGPVLATRQEPARVPDLNAKARLQEDGLDGERELHEFALLEFGAFGENVAVFERERREAPEFGRLLAASEGEPAPGRLMGRGIAARDHAPEPGKVRGAAVAACVEHLCDDLSRAFAEARERTCGRLGERGQDALRLAFWQAGAGNENESFRHSLSIVTGGGQARMETFPTPHLVSP